jgi:hypothetical protein
MKDDPVFIDTDYGCCPVGGTYGSEFHVSPPLIIFSSGEYNKKVVWVWILLIEYRENVYRLREIGS